MTEIINVNVKRPLLGPRGELLKIVDGSVKSQSEARVEQAEKDKQLGDTVKLQLLIGRIEKAVGRNVDQRLLIAACAVVAAKAIKHSPLHKHGLILSHMGAGVQAALWGSYSDEERATIAEAQRKAEAEAAAAAGDAIVEVLSAGEGEADA